MFLWKNQGLCDWKVFTGGISQIAANARECQKFRSRIFREKTKSAILNLAFGIRVEYPEMKKPILSGKNRLFDDADEICLFFA